MDSDDRAMRSVVRAIERYNETEGASVPAAPETVLLGDGGAVDSFGLVRLVLEVERQVHEDHGVEISLTDEKAMSQRNSPFRSVGALTAYLDAQLREGA